MTAEVLIMNTEAVALAADSAVTHQESEPAKIFTSANKMFTLSKYEPVGVMIYGSSRFMGVPWETVIKEYRRKLGNDQFSTLAEYADDLFGYLESDERIAPKSQQRKYFARVVHGHYVAFRKEIEAAVEDVIDEQGEISQQEVEEIAKAVVRERRDEWVDRDGPEDITEDLKSEVREAHDDVITRLRWSVFENLLTSVISRWLGEVAVEIALKFAPPEEWRRTTGLVVAGFGNEEIFPSYEAYRVGGVVHGRLQCAKKSEHSMGHDKPAIIMPFAQTDMVKTFAEGVNPKYREMVEESLARILYRLPREIIDSIDQLSDEEKANKKSSVRRTASRLLREYKGGMRSHRQDTYINPLMSVVSALPKDELADVAESLVRITSFKRRVSLDEETVGGPIDVAVISRGDGFIWMERKHYFEPDLNPHFFENYFREDQDGDENADGD